MLPELPEVLARLDGHINHELLAGSGVAAGRVSGLTLEPMRELCHRLGDPQDAVPAIHVTGTNGKGSVSAIASALVAANGLTATVQWSEPYNGGTARPSGQVVTLPGTIGTGQGGNYFVLGEVSYNYAPLQIFMSLSALTLSGAIYLTPRQSTSITCHDCATAD